MKTLILTIIILSIASSLWATDVSSITLKQLITERPDLIADIKDSKDENTSTITVQQDENGRMVTWTEETKDIDGKVVGKRVEKYTYYKEGPVDTITQEKYTGAVLSKKQVVKHYLDEKQPTVSDVSIGEIIEK
jgi:hypothetical protein